MDYPFNQLVVQDDPPVPPDPSLVVDPSIEGVSVPASAAPTPEDAAATTPGTVLAVGIASYKPRCKTSAASIASAGATGASRLWCASPAQSRSRSRRRFSTLSHDSARLPSASLTLVLNPAPRWPS
jgi:hypothetical protein